ncbi:hypothetical protein EVAR_4772_1 [Eumeta japonica]|uniref:Uncharacterized protein n=1 Tax=Eumeta variegata TaxID=151549 RepID=A0A4C1SYX2_EUMVA|nr:hypothetical protein EVAR_4772_1 [Eumeta japonica]
MIKRAGDRTIEGDSVAFRRKAPGAASAGRALSVTRNPGRPAELMDKDCLKCKIMKVSEQINDGASTPAAVATEAVQADDVIASISTLDCIDVD